MFKVEVTYKTRLGNLAANMTISQSVHDRPDAETLRAALREVPWLADAEIMIKNDPPQTVDEALVAFRKTFAEYPVLQHGEVKG